MTFAELECTLQLVVAPGRTIPVSAYFSYRSWDPYCIHVSFYNEGQTPVSWAFARDLLAEGMVRASGLGDVRIRPGDGEQSGLLCLELSSPEGHALLTMPVDVLIPWLGQTYHLVPVGFEDTSLDLDGELSRLLGEVA
ncbi:SsgA family sporulation/cell division regulator [Streptomyces chartreusis]|uniref:SsgA family sporulation/cell division regulator n=1 Tax=Streptomyces chartreusis TaxID=1969 RepID=UPI0036CF3DF9